MSQNEHKVKAILHCRRCGQVNQICLLVRTGVPPFLRCDHRHHGAAATGSGGGLTCSRCECDWHLDIDHLVAEVEHLLHGQHDDWHRAGGVVVRCG